MCDTWLLTVGDGADGEKDLRRTMVKKGQPHPIELRELALQAIGGGYDEEHAIDAGFVAEADDGLTLIVAEGPNSECSPNGGPWLVARLALVEEG